ncbi:MAG: hypothetical protein ACKO7N_09915 [Candidatus Nitrosotenuis sp.]
MKSKKPAHAKYMNLALAMEKYEKIVNAWKKFGFKDGTLTVWSTQVLEAAINRYSKLFELYPDYTISITTEGKFIIEHGEEMIRVYVKNGKLECTATTNKEIYLTIAALHPFFIV